MSNNKQSSIEYYINNLIDILGDEICNKLTIEQTNRIHFLGKQAKAMHKDEHSKTWDKALDTYEERGSVYVRAWEDFDEYYTETFGNNTP